MGAEESRIEIDESIRPQTLDKRDLKSVARLIKNGKIKNIIVMTGAGISTAAGIPDFRSPKTGLYANLARLDLPYAEAVFDISYFREKPEPFYMLARELYPGQYTPTLAHCFIALLERKSLLRMLFTQNIDCLERAAGVSSSRIVEAHGSFATQRCIDCKTAFSDDLMRDAIQASRVPHCLTLDCNGLVKPDIVFFGESLPSRFFEMRDVPHESDLAIVMGTSLTVQPFASLPQLVPDGVPRVLFNMERVGDLGGRADDVCILASCDEGVTMLAAELGWSEELRKLFEERARKSSKEVPETKRSQRTTDENLEAKMNELTADLDANLKVTNDHRQWIKEGLEREDKKGPNFLKWKNSDKDSSHL